MSKIEKIKKELKRKRTILAILLQLLGLKKKLRELQVELKIRLICKKEGLSEKEADLVVAVARAESGLNPKAVNVKGNYPPGSRDRGLFQWNDYWHPEISDECAFDIECATKAFIKAYKQGNLHWWRSSMKKWGKYLARLKEDKKI